jgi:hypothetical protein
MKFGISILSYLAITCIANAESNSIPGGITERNLGCVTSQPMTGVLYGLTIKIQALAPEYNVRGGEFTKLGVYLGAVVTKFPLELKKQNEEFAFFELENTYSVLLNKKNYTAEIKRGDLVYFNCFEKK